MNRPADAAPAPAATAPAPDLRPASVHQLERTCAHLSHLVELQERTIKQLEAALRSAVTKHHVELLLQGKVTHADMQFGFQTTINELERMLAGKADHAAVDAMLASKVSHSSLESLRSDLLTLKESLRNGEGLEEMQAKQGINPFETYQKQMGDMLRQIKEEQNKMQREAEEKRRQDAANSKSGGGAGSGRAGGSEDSDDSDGEGPIHTGGFNEDGSEILLNADGSPWTGKRRGGGGSGISKRSSGGDGRSAAFTEQEKRELRDKLARMEMAIQLANAGGAGRNGKDGAGGDGTGADSELDRMERAMEAKYARTQRAVDELRLKCTQADTDIERMMRMLEAKNRANAAAAAGAAMHSASHSVPSQELTHFMQELSTLQRGLAAMSPNGGAQSLYESVLLPTARQSASMLVEVRNALREQNRARARILDSLADAKSSVSHDVAALFAQVQLLRRRLKTHSEEFGREWWSLLRGQRQALQHLEEWKRSVSFELDRVMAAAGESAFTLQSLQQPLHDQLRSAVLTETEQRDHEMEARFEREYAQMRERFEAVRMGEEERQRSSPEEKTHADDRSITPWDSTTMSVPATPFAISSHQLQDAHLQQRPQTSPLKASVTFSPQGSPLSSASAVASAANASASVRRASWGQSVPASSTASSAALAASSDFAEASPAAPSSSPRSRSHKLRPATAAYSGYEPAADSAFQSASPSTGPRWVAPHTTRADRPSTCSASGRQLSPSSRPTSRNGLTPRPAASQYHHSQQLSRPSTSASSGRRSFSRGASFPSNSGHYSRFQAEPQSDAQLALELLRERLSMPHLSSSSWSAAASPFAPSPSPGQPQQLHVSIAARTATMTPAPQPAAAHPVVAVAAPPAASPPYAGPLESTAATLAAPLSHRSGSSKSSRIVTSVGALMQQRR